MGWTNLAGRGPSVVFGVARIGRDWRPRRRARLDSGSGDCVHWNLTMTTLLRSARSQASARPVVRSIAGLTSIIRIAIIAIDNEVRPG